MRAFAAQAIKEGGPEIENMFGDDADETWGDEEAEEVDYNDGDDHESDSQ